MLPMYEKEAQSHLLLSTCNKSKTMEADKQTTNSPFFPFFILFILNVYFYCASSCLYFFSFLKHFKDQTAKQLSNFETSVQAVGML